MIVATDRKRYEDGEQESFLGGERVVRKLWKKRCLELHSFRDSFGGLVELWGDDGGGQVCRSAPSTQKLVS